MGIMATQKYDSVSNYLGDSEWWKYGGGGTTGGAGAAIGGAALGLGTLLVNSLTGNKGTGGIKVPSVENQEATQKPTETLKEPGQVINEPIQAVNDLGEVAQQIPIKEQIELPKLEIEDKTDENKEFTLNNFDGYFDILKQLRDEQWAREDAIRAETQAREDSAYQRATEDMLKAGINPNLVGVTPAQSGGGITQATGMNTGLLEEALNAETQKFMKLLEQDWKGDENSKDRVMDIVTTIMQMAGQLGMGLIIGKTTGKTGKK